jgi:uncharacterized protein YdaU (DUF1376 family)
MARTVNGKLRAECFWVDRWQGSSARGLPLEPKGLYREMMSAAWIRGARLPNDPNAIQRLVGCTQAEWDRCWPLVAPYWRVEGDSLVNETQVEVYGTVTRLRQQRRAASLERWAHTPARKQPRKHHASKR